MFSYDPQEESLEKGDFIVFEPNKSNIQADLVTHRIIRVEEGNYTRYFKTKGDANPYPDPGTTPAYNVLGKRAFSVPYIGYIIAATNSLPILLLLLTIPSVLNPERGKKIADNKDSPQDDLGEIENSRKTVHANKKVYNERPVVRLGEKEEES